MTSRAGFLNSRRWFVIALVTIGKVLNYLARSSSGELVAESRVVHRGRTLCVGECDVFNTPAPSDKAPAPARTLVARFSATFIARPKRSDDMP